MMRDFTSDARSHSFSGSESTLSVDVTYEPYTAKDEDLTILGWERPDDARNPVNWSLCKKWTVMGSACLIMFCVEINATSITSAATEISHHFSISDSPFPNSYWPVTSWTIAGAICPPILTPLIEDHGTRPGVLILYALFSLFVIPQAVAGNFATLVVTRIVAGGCGSTIAAMVDGIAADLWEGERGRGRGVVVYTFALVGGYTFGPVFGGAIIGSLGWPWIFYIQLILYFLLFAPLYFLFPETRAPVILENLMETKDKQPQPSSASLSSSSPTINTSKLQTLRVSLLRPTQLLCTEPVLASFTLWSSFTLGMIFMFTQSIPQVYTAVYAWSESSTGLVQGAVFAGQMVALPCCWLFNDWSTNPDPIIITQTNDKSKNTNTKENSGSTTPTPEKKLVLSIPATLLFFAGGFFLYAWTATTTTPAKHWIAPTLGLALVGAASMIIITAIDTYITSCYAPYASSAIAAVTFGENLVSAFLPLATTSMYTRLGSEWASSLLGFVGVAMVVPPFVLVLWGRRIRERSRFMRAGGA